jgi:hypothetical protein
MGRARLPHRRHFGRRLGPAEAVAQREIELADDADAHSRGLSGRPGVTMRPVLHWTPVTERATRRERRHRMSL